MPLNTQVACPFLIGAATPRVSRPGSRKPSAEEESPQRTDPLSLRTPATVTLNFPDDCALAPVASAGTRTRGKSSVRIGCLQLLQVIWPCRRRCRSRAAAGSFRSVSCWRPACDFEVAAGSHGGNELVG